LLCLALMATTSGITLYCAWSHIWNRGFIYGVESERKATLEQNMEHILAQRRGYVQYLKEREQRDG
jgi:hypothetical protein